MQAYLSLVNSESQISDPFARNLVGQPYVYAYKDGSGTLKTEFWLTLI